MRFGRALSARLASVPDARNENVFRLHHDIIAHDIAGRAEANYDLTYTSILSGRAHSGKFLQSINCRPDQRQSAPRGIGISLIEKSSQSLDIQCGVVRKKNHPTLRGCGRGSSSAEPQLATHALTSSGG